MGHYEKHLESTIIYAIIIGVIIYGVWESYYDIALGEQNKYNTKYIVHWSFVNMIMYFGVTMMMGTIGEMIYPHHAENLHVLTRMHLIGMGIYNICLYIVIGLRDQSITNYKFMELKISLDQKVVQLAKILYLITGIVLIIISLTPHITAKAALFAALFASVQFILVKQYVAYISYKKVMKI